MKEAQNVGVWKQREKRERRESRESRERRERRERNHSDQPQQELSWLQAVVAPVALWYLLHGCSVFTGISIKSQTPCWF